MPVEATKQDVGPDYVPKDEKPTATVSTNVAYDNVLILPQTPQLIALMTYVYTVIILSSILYILKTQKPGYPSEDQRHG